MSDLIPKEPMNCKHFKMLTTECLVRKKPKEKHCVFCRNWQPLRDKSFEENLLFKTEEK